MFPNINPKKMQALMKQMGISQEDIDAKKVIIEKNDNTKTIIENPSVAKVMMQGQQTYQISGDEREEIQESEVGEAGVSEQDIKTVVEKTGCTEEQAREALEKTGDLAEAIMKLSD